MSMIYLKLHEIYLLSPYKVVVENLLANSCISIYPLDTEQYYHSFVVFFF